LLQEGKLAKVKHEMVRLGINVLGISETRSPGQDNYENDGFRIIHSGGEESQQVVKILDKRTDNCVEKVRFNSGKLLMVKLTGKPVDMCIIHVYMPTMEHTEEELEDTYEKHGTDLGR